MKTTFLFLLSTLTLFARYNAMPSMQCEAYNNMKHTKNTHHVVLETTKEYTVIRSHKGQKLILIKGVQPAQRWVDQSCFFKKNLDNVSPAKNAVLNIEDILKRTNKKSNIPKQTLLTLSWHNAFCETHRRKKECRRGMLSGLKKRYSESHFVLHGLWPQPKNKLYCNVEKRYITIDRYKKWYKLPNLGLSQETKESLKKIMPGFYSNLHKHEWFKHGTCYGTTAESYYLDAIHLVNQVNSAKVGTFFIKHIGKSVTLKQIRYVFDSSFGTGAGKRVEMKCKNGLIVELWLHLGGEGDSLIERLKQGKSTRSRCQKGRIDRVGFGR